ncbi:unnamed protein product [Arabis nemorensis]|uniref:Uncharacterized protein n=1 Tax=Arabis nemorensis TaxID=586526 RepID=A0A565BKR4_9BRAS|nr:unnamed protein product [Arabis nemorensis]
MEEAVVHLPKDGGFSQLALQRKVIKEVLDNHGEVIEDLDLFDGDGIGMLFEEKEEVVKLKAKAPMMEVFKIDLIDWGPSSKDGSNTPSN